MTGSSDTRFTLPAIERLKLRKKIETLFLNGEAFSVYPLRIVYRLEKSDISSANTSKMQMGISVPKKRMRFAHERNRVKRLTREAWRLNKHNLVSFVPEGLQLQIFFIFVGKVMPNFDMITLSIQGAIKKFQPILSTLSQNEVNHESTL